MPPFLFCAACVAFLTVTAPDTGCVYTGFVHDIEKPGLREFSMRGGPNVVMKGRKVWFVPENGDKHPAPDGSYTTYDGERFHTRNGKLVMPKECGG